MEEKSEISYSAAIQGILELEISRSLRFRNDRKGLLLYLLRLHEGMEVVDLGCGPGTLTRKLASWLGQTSKIIGVDKDKDFLEYARSKAKDTSLNNVEFIEGDVLDIPLANESVDACVSNTVIEHVSNKRFLLEQKRICRKGGIVSVMMAQPKSYIHSYPDSANFFSDREIELRKHIDNVQQNIQEDVKPGRYWPEPSAIPRLFDDLGFSEIQVDSLAVPIVLDDSRNTLEEKMAFLNAQQSVDLEYINRMLSLAPDIMPDRDVKELKNLIVERYDKRRHMITKGATIWDFEISIILIVSGHT